MHWCGRVLDRTECIGVVVCWIEQSAWYGRVLDRTECIGMVVFLIKESALVWLCVG